MISELKSSAHLCLQPSRHENLLVLTSFYCHIERCMLSIIPFFFLQCRERDSDILQCKQHIVRQFYSNDLQTYRLHRCFNVCVWTRANIDLLERNVCISSFSKPFVLPHWIMQTVYDEFTNYSDDECEFSISLHSSSISMSRFNAIIFTT